MRISLFLLGLLLVCANVEAQPGNPQPVVIFDSTTSWPANPKVGDVWNNPAGVLVADGASACWTSAVFDTDGRWTYHDGNGGYLCLWSANAEIKFAFAFVTAGNGGTLTYTTSPLSQTLAAGGTVYQTSKNWTSTSGEPAEYYTTRATVVFQTQPNLNGG